MANNSEVGGELTRIMIRIVKIDIMIVTMHVDPGCISEMLDRKSVV